MHLTTTEIDANVGSFYYDDVEPNYELPPGIKALTEINKVVNDKEPKGYETKWEINLKKN